jgi:hypothetical protein
VTQNIVTPEYDYKAFFESVRRSLLEIPLVVTGDTRQLRRMAAQNLDSAAAPLPLQKSYLTPFPTGKLIAKLEEYVRKGLTCTIANGIFMPVDGNDMDATALKILERLKQLDEQQGRIRREQTALLTALEVAGVKPQGAISGQPGSETNYRIHGAFKDRPLPACCEIILKDHKGQWLTKSEIEYLIVQGGYEFTTGDTKNSVGGTLQRMAREGSCEVERTRGNQGNRYRWPSEQAKEAT